MLDVISAIDARRSNRGYSKEKLTKAEIAALVKAGTDSPSTANTQPWHFTVVTNTDILDQFNKELAVVLGREDKSFHAFFHAPCCIFITARFSDERNWAYLDSGIAVENIALAAVGLGLGSVILGMPKHLFEKGDGAAWKARLNIPEDHEFAIAIAVGHPTMTKDAHIVGPGKVNYVE